MQPSTPESAYMVYKRVIPSNYFEFKCDSHMLKVLLCLNGKINNASIAKQTGLSLDELTKATSKLLSLDLIASADGDAIYLSRDFMDFLKAQLSIAVGPIAEILIEDSIKDLGHESGRVPQFKAANLVELLSKEIQNGERRMAFQQNMVARIKKG